MKISRVRKLWPVAAAAIFVFILLFVSGSRGTASPGTRYSLAAPSFIGVAHAAADNLALETIQNEAGISAYFQSNNPVSISSVRSVYQTIELETSDYILGSVRISDYPEEHSPHVYVHTDGWFMAYYLKTDPVAKIIDWNAYIASGDTAISTKLETVLAITAGAAGVGITTIHHYDFRYPNANTMIMIIERDQGGGNNYYTINIPSSFGVTERSWSQRCYDSRCGYFLNGTNIKGSSIGVHPYYYGLLTAAQLPPNTTHTLSFNYSSLGGLVLVYTE